MAVFVFKGVTVIHQSNSWLHRFALLTAVATLGLVAMGGLVTSHGVGMAVPDWPTSYGYNMFALPISTWLTGGVFHEHTHRLWASAVGVLVVALTRWLGGSAARWPLVVIGVCEIVAGQLMFRAGTQLHGAGHFLSGIGSVVLLSGIVWFRHRPCPAPLPLLGWLAFALVQIQGLLGGLRVVLDSHIFADVRLGTVFGVLHGCLAQMFLVLLAIIALQTSSWWQKISGLASVPRRRQDTHKEIPQNGDTIQRIFLAATLLVFLQLILGALMRHQHSGLAIPDFPLAYGSLWPDTSSVAVARYNAQRVETFAVEPITSPQILLQMTHRLVAVFIVALVVGCVWATKTNFPLERRLARFWLGLILTQVALGAWVIWSKKAADVATGHVVVGSLSLVTGALSCLICFRRIARGYEAQGASFSKSVCTQSPSAALNP